MTTQIVSTKSKDSISLGYKAPSPKAFVKYSSLKNTRLYRQWEILIYRWSWQRQIKTRQIGLPWPTRQIL